MKATAPLQYKEPERRAQNGAGCGVELLPYHFVIVYTIIKSLGNYLTGKNQGVGQQRCDFQTPLSSLALLCSLLD